MNTRIFLTTEKTAELLGISVGSVSNWTRHGYLTRTKRGFEADEVADLIERIKSGEVERMNRRANKKRADGNITPGGKFRRYYEAVVSAGLGNPAAMLILCARLFTGAGAAAEKDVRKLLSPEGALLDRDSIGSTGSNSALNHIKRWLSLIAPEEMSNLPSAYDRLLNLDIPGCSPAENDIAGIVYQGLKHRGERARSGSFYTPPEIAGSLMPEGISAATAFLDPCCGTGQFLISFIAAGGATENTYGIDSDPLAVLIAQSNLILMNPDTDCTGRIVTGDSLLGFPQDFPEHFDLVATNPPWGSCGAEQKRELLLEFPHLRGMENFSFFISRSLSLARDGGRVSMVLPESITNVKKHRDIRKHILKNAEVKKVTKHGQAFKNVFTQVITLELKKAEGQKAVSETSLTTVSDSNESYEIRQSAFSSNPDCIFNINIKSADSKIIDKLYSLPHTTLKNRADWALGIVTGDNRQFLSCKPLPGMEPVIRGSDILPGTIKEPSVYIEFTPERFQQTAPSAKYRCSDKLVYRFVSRRLVFAADRGGRLTLNSANIVIPRIENCSAAAIMELFNSDLYNFIYRKKFNSIKVLRSHLEELPVPLDLIDQHRCALAELSDLLKLTEKEMNYIKAAQK